MSIKGLNAELARLYEKAAAETPYAHYQRWCLAQADIFRSLDAGKAGR